MSKHLVAVTFYPFSYEINEDNKIISLDLCRLLSNLSKLAWNLTNKWYVDGSFGFQCLYYQFKHCVILFGALQFWLHYRIHNNLFLSTKYYHMLLFQFKYHIQNTTIVWLTVRIIGYVFRRIRPRSVISVIIKRHDFRIIFHSQGAETIIIFVWC